MARNKLLHPELKSGAFSSYTFMTHADGGPAQVWGLERGYRGGKVA